MKTLGNKKKSLGQSIVEYSILAALFLAAIVAIQVYVCRSIKGRIKQSIDEYGGQYSNKYSNYTFTDVVYSATWQTQQPTGESKSTLAEDEVRGKPPYLDDFSNKKLSEEGLWD